MYMSLRTILIFPKFSNIDIVNQIREKYDPLAKLIDPHITLVFPFECDLSNDEIHHILDNRLDSFSSFHLILSGVRKHISNDGFYLFLGIKQGKNEVVTIHDILYKFEFKVFDVGIPYIPHITLGKFSNEALLDEVFKSISKLKLEFEAYIDTISVEKIDKDGKSIIIINKKLN
jgi:2'-5' RNA ligase